MTVCGAAAYREVGLQAEEALVGGGEPVQHGALVRRRAGVREAQRDSRRAHHHEFTANAAYFRQPWVITEYRVERRGHVGSIVLGAARST